MNYKNQFGTFSHNLSIDEKLVIYFERCSCKMFTRVDLPDLDSNCDIYIVQVDCICIDGVIIAAQCTATFSDLLCSPKFRYY